VLDLPGDGLLIGFAPWGAGFPDQLSEVGLDPLVIPLLTPGQRIEERRNMTTFELPGQERQEPGECLGSVLGLGRRWQGLLGPLGWIQLPA
jgi:hypothetical protein